MADRRRIVNHPRNRKEVAFCEAFLKHSSPEQAWRDAGYSDRRNGWGRRARTLVVRLAPHLEPLIAARSKAVAERHAISLDDVMEELCAVAFANPDDYYSYEGEQFKQKPWGQLTRRQKAACQITRDVFGNITGYALATLKVKHDYLHSLGQQLGGFLPAAIQERTMQRHNHLHLHLESVPTEELAAMEKKLLALCPPEVARSLGITLDQEKINAG